MNWPVLGAGLFGAFFIGGTIIAVSAVLGGPPWEWQELFEKEQRDLTARESWCREKAAQAAAREDWHTAVWFQEHQNCQASWEAAGRPGGTR